jgi:uncharacterized protein (DUF885 family)
MLRPVLLVLALSAALVPTPLPARTPAAPAPSVPVSATAASVALHALFDEEWERGLREFPESATANGDLRFNDRWTDQSLEAIERRDAADRAVLARLRGIDRGQLSDADKLSYDVFLWDAERTVARQRYREWQRPLSQRGGVQTADELVEILQFRSLKDYEDWLARLEALPAVIDQTVVLLREGLKAGNTPPRVLMQRVPAQIAAQVVDDPTLSRFYLPFRKFPDAIAAPDRERLRARAAAVIGGRVVPAYRDFGAFFAGEYLPGTRETIAAADLPDGRAYYDFLAGQFTTTSLTADEIHAIGLREVARIRAEMEKVRAEVGFKGSLAQFFEHLRTDPKFFKKTPAELLEAYQAISKRIDPELVKVSRIIPRMPYGVRPIPDAVAPDTTTAYYQRPALDGSRAGYYYVNLYKPDVRPTWEMMALSLHEAVPGHHFQIARAMELPDVPKFRRAGYFTAYGEGWGLYAERLGYDMGLYDDPYDRMGQLAYDMWRAVRLVVDTGMHSKGWSRDRAIGYFMDNAPKTRQDVVNEIDRYISWPGQALAYKIGQLKISALREKAARELGARFDLRDFNDAVLVTGAVPLDVLEAHMDAWIAQRKAAPAG